MDVDAVVLDIDNVLVDTDESYDRAIIETLRATYGRTIDPEAIQWFKDAGGFNNDWRVTDAAALFIIATERGYDADLRSYTAAIASRGGGLDAARSVIAEALGSDGLATVEAAWEQEELRRTFQWAYLGGDRYRDLEDVDPPAHRPATTGLIDEETVLVEPTTLTALRARYPLGVHTGRPREEALIALDRLDLDVPGDHLISMDDWDGGKPEPTGLMTLAERLEATAVAYAGDELDDVRTAVNAAAADADRSYYGIGVQSGGVVGATGKQRFEAVGAAAVIESVDDLPALLDG